MTFRGYLSSEEFGYLLMIPLFFKNLKTILEFFRINQISVNFSKTKYIVFHSPFLPHCDLPVLQTSNSIIERVDNFKYLGVIFDKHMAWEDHINAMSLKINPFICLIRKLSVFVPVHVLKMIYFSFIHTRLFYATATFGTATQSKLKKLQILQNKCCKAIYKLPHLFPTAELYRSVALDIFPINSLFVLYVSCYMYKCLHISSMLSNITFEFVNHGYVTRNSNMLKCPQIKTEYGRNSISFTGPFIFNNLPEDIRNANNIFKFKNMLKVYLASLLQNYLY